MPEEYIKKARDILAKHPNYVVGATWCSDCKRAQEVWERLGVADQINTVHYDKLPDQEAAEKVRDAFMEIAGVIGFPCIFLGGEYFGGDKELIEAEKAGTLNATLTKAGIRI